MRIIDFITILKQIVYYDIISYCINIYNNNNIIKVFKENVPGL